MQPITMMTLLDPSRDTWRTLVKARDEFVSAPDDFSYSRWAAHVRPEIVGSWRRSLTSGVDPYSTDIARVELTGSSGRLLRAAEPVLECLADRLASTPIAIYLTDAQGRILQRVVNDREFETQLDRVEVGPGYIMSEEQQGTNGIGTPIENRDTIFVSGSEHYREKYSEFTCIGVPIRHPIDNRLEGILDLTCPFKDTNRLALPFVEAMARAVEQQLYAAATASEQMLLAAYLQAKRRYRNVVAAAQNTLISSASASQLLEDVDRDVVLQCTSEAADSRHPITRTIKGRSGLLITVQCTPVEDGGRFVGVVATLTAGVHSAESRRLSPHAQSLSARGRSTVWKRTIERVDGISQSHLPVIIRGERGVGKSYLARELHNCRGPAKPLMEFDCASTVAAGREWPAQLHAAVTDSRDILLRHLDELPANLSDFVQKVLDQAAGRCRVIATATVEPSDTKLPGDLLDTFVLDLYVPPLRERIDDLPALVRELVADIKGGPPLPRFGAGALQALARNQWAGNIAELRRVVTGVVVNTRFADVTEADIPVEYRRVAGPPCAGGLERLERDAIIATLRDTKWNRERAAQVLGISRTTLWRRMKQFGLAEQLFLHNSSGLSPLDEPGGGALERGE